MNEFSFSNVLDQGWAFFKKYGLLLGALFLAAEVIQSIVQAFFIPSDKLEEFINMSQSGAILTTEDLIQQLSNLSTGTSISSIIGIYFFAALFALAIGLVKGTKTGFDTKVFTMPFMVYLKYFVVTLIYGLIIGIGFVCCIIPGVFLAAKLQYSQFYILEDYDCGIGEAFTKSWNITKGHVLTLIGLGVAYLVMLVVGVFLCIIGIYFALALVTLCAAVSYFMLKEKPAQEIQKVPAAE